MLDRAHGRIALHDIQLAAGGVLGAAVDELLHAVGEVHLLGDVFLDRDAGLFGVLAALLVDQYLLAGFFGLVGVLDKIDFQLMLEEVGHGLRHEFIGDGLLGLVLVARAGGEIGGDQNQAVLHIGKGDGALVFLVQALLLEPGIDLVDKGQAHGAVRAAAVFKPAGVVVIFQRLVLVGEAERGVHLHLVLGLVGAVAAAGRTGAGVHRRERRLPRQLGHMVDDAVFIVKRRFLGALARAVVEHERDARVDDGLPLEHIAEGIRRNGDIGKDGGVRQPADDRAGPAAGEFFLVQAADVLAVFEIKMIMEPVAVDVGGHPGAGILGGAQAQAV